MQTHGPKRVYTPHSLEYWFDILADDWSETFTSSQLDEGRRIYRNGEVRELELTDRDAIIHRRIEKKDEYAVIEWTSGTLSVRSSTTDREIAHALAVAGLHEIEELVADEISPLPADPETLTRLSAGAGNGKAAEGGAALSGGPVPRLNGPSRPLMLVFKIKSSGLSFQACWVDGDRKTRHPALGPDAHSHGNGNGHVSSGERAKLIGLAAYARKAHFQYNQDTGAYLMESLVEIPNFLKVTLPLWKRVFSIELDDKTANLLKGTRSVEIEAVAERSQGDAGLNLRWIFRTGERMLTDAEVSSLLKRGGQPVILPNLGIVALSAEKWESFSSWRRNLADTQEGGAAQLQYLIFSLFNDARLKLTLSPEMEAWRQRVLAAPQSPPQTAAILRPYQRRGVEWMHHLCEVDCHGLLADEMGLGKTLQVLALLAIRATKERPSVIVCPASVVPVWREEVSKFFPEIRVDVLKTGNDFSSNKDPVIWLCIVGIGQQRERQAELVLKFLLRGRGRRRKFRPEPRPFSRSFYRCRGSRTLLSCSPAYRPWGKNRAQLFCRDNLSRQPLCRSCRRTEVRGFIIDVHGNLSSPNIVISHASARRHPPWRSWLSRASGLAPRFTPRNSRSTSSANRSTKGRAPWDWCKFPRAAKRGGSRSLS